MKRLLINTSVSAVLMLLILVFTTCSNPFSAGLGKKVDIEAPSLEITSHRNGDAVGSIFDLFGTVTDDDEISSVKISLDTAANVLGSASIDGNSWIYSYDSSGLTDGDHEFIVEASDNTGKSASLKILLTVDNNPPTVIVTVPASYGVDEELNKKITIKGDAADTTRVKEVLISLYDTNGTPSTADDSVVISEAHATGTSSWYYSFDSETLGGGLNGEYYFFVTADDYSGNRNSYFYHFEDILNAASDPANLPNVEEINDADFGGVPLGAGIFTAPVTLADLRKTTIEGEEMLITVNPDSDKPDFIFISPGIVTAPADPLAENVFASPQRLSGFIEDDDGVDFDTLDIKISECDPVTFVATSIVTDWTPIDSGDISGTQWTYETNLPDGNYKVDLRVDDIYGASNTTEGFTDVPFRVSSFVPVVTVTTPAQGSYVGNNSVFTVTANVSALGSGTVELDPTGDDDWTDALTMTNGGGGVYTLYMTGGIDFTAVNGQITFKVRAGISGNYGTGTLQLTGDIDLPTVTVEYPSDGDDKVNGTINIAGTSSDNTLISNVYLWIEEDAVPATDPPADFTTWKNPDGTDVYNWIYNIDTNTLNPGAHTFHLKAVDAAGNESADFSSAFTVNQEEDRPDISLSNMVIGGTGFENGLGRDASIIGLAEDDDGIDAATIEVRIDLNDDGDFTGMDLSGDLDTDDENESEQWVPVSDPPGSNTRIVSWSHSLLNVPQGEHSMQIRVHDINSDGVTFDMPSNPNYREIPETRFVIDYGPPDLSITGPANGEIFNIPFSISGTASDANGVEDVEISINGGGFTTVMDPADSGNITVNWNYDFAVDAGGANDGDYSYQIQATDTSGGKTTLDRQLVVDATAPQLVIEIPGAGSAVNGSAVSISGTASDNRDVQTVYQFIEEQGTPPPALGLWDIITGTYSWTSVLDSLNKNDTAAAANYVIYMRAEDKAGNISGQYTRTISIDQFSDRPVIDFNDIDKDETVAANNVLVGATNLTGTIEDDDLIDPTLFANQAIEINIDGTGWAAVDQPPAASGKVVVWKHDISALDEGAHTVRLRARDNQSVPAGIVGTASTDYSVAPFDTDYNWAIADGPSAAGIPFILNIGPPSITIDTPPNYSYHNTDVVVSGTASDANDVQSVFISTDNGSNWTDLGITPGSPVLWSYTLPVAANGDDDGTYSYLIRATDAYGSTGIENGQFTVDATEPTVEITQPAAGEDVNGLITIRGTAEDNIQVEDVYIHVGPSGLPDPAPPVYNPPPGSPSPGDYNHLTGTYSWNYSFDTSAIISDSYTLRVISMDAAGNLSLLTDTVNKVDFDIEQATDRPQLSFLSFTGGGEFVENELLLSRLIKGEVFDDDAVDTSSIQYQLYAADGMTLLIDWTTVSEAAVAKSGGWEWSHVMPDSFVDSQDSDGDLDTTEVLPISDGRYQMKLRAADIFDAGSFTPGGFGWVETPLVKFGIDTANPVINLTSPAANGIFTNTDFDITGNVTDDGGIAEITIQYGTDPAVPLYTDGAEPYSTDVAWPVESFEVNESSHENDGRVDFTLTVTDAFGNSSYIDRNFFVDTQAPAAAVTSPSTDGSIVNGLFTLSGTAADVAANGFTGEQSAVYIYTGTTAPGAFPAGYVPADGSSYNWSWTIDTTLIGDDLYEAHLVAVDSAGNAGTPVVRTYQISQSSDRPVIDITSINEAGEFMENILPGSKQIGGTVTDDDSVDISTIQYRLVNSDNSFEITGWTPVNGTSGGDNQFSSWTHTFGAEVTDGQYQVQFRAADTNDAGAWTGGGFGWSETGLIKFTYDSANPLVTVTNPSDNGGYTNQDLLIEGTADDAGGIKSIDIQFNPGDSHNLYYDDTGSSISETWNYTFSVDDIDNLNDGLLNYVISATDSFDKISSVERYIYIDTEAPQASITIPSTAEVVNGLIAFRGEAEDTEANGFTGLQDEVWLYVGLSTDTPVFTGIEGGDYEKLSGIYSWSYDFNTFTDPATFEPDGTYRLHVIAVDAAGNSAADTTVDFVVNQASDRPELLFTSITSGGSYTDNLLPGSKQITGTVEDDDSVDVSTIEYQLFDPGDLVTPVQPWTAVTGPPAGDRVFASWSQTFGAAVTDGKYQVQFRAADTNDTGVWTAGGYGWVETGLERISIDTSSPAVTFTDITVDEAYTEGDETYPASAGLLINRSFTLTGTVTDGNELTTLKISTDGTDPGDFSPIDSGLVSPWNHQVPITLGGADDGTMTIYVQAEDEFGKVTTISLPVIIDTIDPQISPTQPTGIDFADPVNVNGDVTLRGTITEVSGIASFSAKGGVSDDVTLNNTGSDLSWVLSFDSDMYASPAYGSEISEGRTDTLGNPYTATLYRFPVDITTFDNAGNRGAETYNVDIDPDSDKPLLYLTAPAADSSVAGAFIVQGTASDDDDIQLVTIQVDLDDNGVYSDVNYDLSDAGTTAGDGDFENESVPVNVTVTNGSWNILINQNNEFSKTTLETAGFVDPTGWIRLRVIPIDTNGLPGITTEIRIYVDSTAPIITGQGVALPTPAAGTTVRGTASIAARFQDDKQLLSSKMQISFDGGVSYQSISSAGGMITDKGLVGDYYEYDIDLDINTTDGGGIVAGGNGILQTVLKVTDETFKQNSYSLQLNVDNTLPTGVFNYNDSLSYFGPPVNKVYSFYGNETQGGDYMLIGSVEDTETISGIEKVDVYFVKSVLGIDYFYNPTTGVALEVDVNTATVTDMSGTDHVIPMPPTGSYSDYVISVDNRSERGIDDDDPIDGDQDGFQESLRSKGTYDEWYVYFDSEVFSDGPMDMFTLVYDTAGNYSFEQVDIQIANSPPVISSIETDGGGTPYNGLFKATGSLYLLVNATSTEGLVTSSYKATLIEKVEAPDGDPTALGPALDTEYDIADTSTDDENEITIDIRETPATDFVSNVTYTFTVEVADINGNITSTDVDVWVDNLDTTFPTVSFDTFDQANVADTAGHIESAIESTNDAGTADADLSGTVRITGTAWDDNGVSDIELSFDGGSTWTSVPGGNITIDLELSSLLTGKFYTWYYDWNSAGLPDVTAEDLTINVRVSDTAVPTANSGTDLTQVDVVPYITGILRDDSIYNTNRTKYGKYLLQQNESDITISGYNLRDAVGDWLRIYNSAGDQYDDVNITSSALVPNELTISTVGMSASGVLRMSVNDVEDGNYGNTNSLIQNKEDDGSGLSSSLWNDDRYIFIWDVSEAFSGSSDAQYPAMEMNDTNGDLVASWSHYLTTAMRTGTPTNNPAGTPANEVDTSQDMFEYNDIAVDTAGDSHLIYLDNLYFEFFGSTWGWLSTRDSSGGNANVERLGDDANDSVNHGDGQDEYLYQFRNPKIMVVDDYNYFVYYDAWAQALKYGVTNNNTATFVGSQNYTNGANVVAGQDDFDNDPTDSGDNVGTYSAIGLDPDDSRIVIVFYNQTQNILQLAKGAQVHGGAGSPALNNANNSDWTVQDVPMGSYAGQYVNMAIDLVTGDLHIVGYRISNGDLVYIHAADVDGAGVNYTFDAPVVIDSSGNTGKYADITLFGSTPYISYLCQDVGTFDGAKFAYDTGGGNWEYGIVPSDSPVTDQRTSIEVSSTASWGKAAIAYGSDFYSLAYLLGEK